MKYSIEEIKQGSIPVFRKLYEDFYPTLTIFALRYLNDNMQAADVVQNTFIKFWERKDNFDSYFKIKSFLYIVVKHECLNIIRDNKKMVYASIEKFDSVEFYRNALVEEESYRIFYHAVNSLPKQCNRIINLAIEGKKNSEIAKILGISEGTVHKQKKISYKKLRILLNDNYYLIWLFMS